MNTGLQVPIHSAQHEARFTLQNTARRFESLTEKWRTLSWNQYNTCNITNTHPNDTILCNKTIVTWSLLLIPDRKRNFRRHDRHVPPGGKTKHYKDKWRSTTRLLKIACPLAKVTNTVKKKIRQQPHQVVILHHLLNVSVQIANKRGFKKIYIFSLKCMTFDDICLLGRENKS
jgi:hypothetical protein